MINLKNVSAMLRKGIAVACVLLVGSVAQAQVSVIVGKSSAQTAGVAEIKQMFAGAKLTWVSGEKVAIADQPEASISKSFYEKFVGKSVSQIRTEWMKLVLSGQAAAPKKCTDDDAVKTYVNENPKAIGFISSSSLDGSVKELHRVSTSGN